MLLKIIGVKNIPTMNFKRGNILIVPKSTLFQTKKLYDPYFLISLYRWFAHSR